MEEGSRLVAESPSYAHAEEKVQRLTGAAISDTTLWRLFGEVGEMSLAILEGEEAAINAPVGEEEMPGEERCEAHDPVVGERVSVSTDGFFILTREEGWREVKAVSVSVIEAGPGRNAREREAEEKGGRSEGEPEIHLTRHSYRFRMANAAEFAGIHYAEIARRRVPYAGEIVSVNDGAGWCWQIAGDNLPEAVEVLDWAHAMEHVKAVAQAAFGEESEGAEKWYEEVETILWEGDVERVLGEKWCDLPRRQRQRGKTIRNGRAYFREHRERMRYKEFRQRGYPIGSGTIESGGKNGIQWRMKRGGARWSTDRVNPMLAVLGELSSGRWSELWERIRLLKERKCA